MQRVYHDEFTRHNLTKINNVPISKPPEPKCRRPIRPESSEANDCHKPIYILKNNMSSDNSDHDQQMTSDPKIDEQKLNSLSESPSRSRTNSSEGISNNGEDQFLESCKKSQSSKEELQEEKDDKLENMSGKWHLSNIVKNKNNYIIAIKIMIIIMTMINIVISVVYLLSSNSANGNQTEFTTNKNSVFKIIEDIKTKFYNQDSYIWNEILSGINEVKTRNPKVPSIILLFANETHTMDCLASALAHFSNNALGGDSPLNLNAKDFGDDPGEIIDNLKNTSAKTVIIRNILNIHTKAIKALHNLCDRENPLIREVIYIITMQTKNYESSQQKMAFVEKQLYRELMKNIDKDILMALITRITDGAIILVQPEPNIRYC